MIRRATIAPACATARAVFVVTCLAAVLAAGPAQAQLGRLFTSSQERQALAVQRGQAQAASAVPPASGLAPPAMQSYPAPALTQPMAAPMPAMTAPLPAGAVIDTPQGIPVGLPPGTPLPSAMPGGSSPADMAGAILPGVAAYQPGGGGPGPAAGAAYNNPAAAAPAPGAMPYIPSPPPGAPVVGAPESAAMPGQPATTGSPPASAEQLQLNGVLRTSSGRSTVWLNNAPQPAGAAAFSQRSRREALTVTLPSGRRIILQPGQRYDLAAGRVKDVGER